MATKNVELQSTENKNDIQKINEEDQKRTMWKEGSRPK